MGHGDQRGSGRGYMHLSGIKAAQPVSGYAWEMVWPLALMFQEQTLAITGGPEGQ